MILGCAGKSLTRDEIRFYRNECPWGFILFARNIGETEQIRDLVAEMRDCIGRPDALVRSREMVFISARRGDDPPSG